MVSGELRDFRTAFDAWVDQANRSAAQASAVQLFLAGMREVLGDALSFLAVVQVRDEVDTGFRCFVARLGDRVLGARVELKSGDEAIRRAGRQMGDALAQALMQAPRRADQKQVTRAEAPVEGDTLRHVRFFDEEEMVGA